MLPKHLPSEWLPETRTFFFVIADPSSQRQWITLPTSILRCSGQHTSLKQIQRAKSKLGQKLPGVVPPCLRIIGRFALGWFGIMAWLPQQGVLFLHYCQSQAKPERCCFTYPFFGIGQQVTAKMGKDRGQKAKWI